MSISDIYMVTTRISLSAILAVLAVLAVLVFVFRNENHIVELFILFLNRHVLNVI
jgi:hypothetical protein